jgi:hypothetical protein
MMTNEGEHNAVINSSGERRVSRTARVVLWFMMGATLLLAIATVYIGWLQYREEFVGVLPWLLGSGLAPFSLGLFILFHQPANRYGWVWVGFGSAVIFMLFTQAYAEYSLSVGPQPLPLTDAVIALVGPTWALAVALTSPIFLLFPDGKPSSPRWRWLLPFIAIVYCLAAISAVLAGVQEGLLARTSW